MKIHKFTEIFLQLYFKILSQNKNLKKLPYSKRIYSNFKKAYEQASKFETEEYLFWKPLSAQTSFEAFLTWLVTPSNLPKDDNLKKNNHWQPYWEICSPCQVPYSIVSKIESIHEESHVILSKLTTREIGKFPGAYGTTKFDNNEYLNKLRELYRNVPREIMDKIYEKYEIDFDLFNYEKI